MSNEEIECLRDLHKVIKGKKNDIIPVSQIWILFHKYNDYHNCADHENSRQNWNENHEDHKILYFLLEKLYISRCTDLNLVSVVIKRIHSEGIRFDSIISSLFNENKNFETDEIIPIFEYCLKYTYMKKILFNGCRMASVDCFFTEMLLPKHYYTSSLPEIMKILLQYGIFLDPITGEAPTVHDLSDDPEIEDFNAGAILLWDSIFNEGIIRNNPQFLPINELPNKQKEIFNICVKIANMFIRTSLNIKISIFLFPLRRLHCYLNNQNSYDLSNIKYQNKLDVVNFIHKLGCFIPELPRRCLEPLSLKYGCKQIIRKLLHLNWMLPSGIFNLNLPMSLVQYLNLEMD